jgi:hypothetical protein
MNAAATCPWCGAILADPSAERCPTCDAALVARPGMGALSPAATPVSPSGSVSGGARTASAPKADAGAVRPAPIDRVFGPVEPDPPSPPGTDPVAEPLIPGLTISERGWSTEALRATDPLLARALSTSPFRPDEADLGVEYPSEDVRRLMRQMELERIAAEREAHRDIVPPGIASAQLESSDAPGGSGDESEPAAEPRDGGQRAATEDPPPGG